MAEQRLAPGVLVDDALLTWSASRSGGPGGQHVNTTATRIELRLPLAAIRGLGVRAMERLVALLGERLTADGQVLLTCDETRSQRRNRELLWERLEELVREAKAVPPPRRATRPSRGSVQRRLDGKAQRSEVKRLRQEPP